MDIRKVIDQYMQDHKCTTLSIKDAAHIACILDPEYEQATALNTFGVAATRGNLRAPYLPGPGTQSIRTRQVFPNDLAEYLAGFWERRERRKKV